MTVSPPTAFIKSQDTEIGLTVEANRLVVSHLMETTSRFAWVSGASATPIAFVSKVEFAGNVLPLRWIFQGSKFDKSQNKLTFLFASASPKLELISTWKASKSHGPIEHSIEIINRSPDAIGLPMQTSLEFRAMVPKTGELDQWWVEKEAGGPGPDGVHKQSIAENYSQDLYSTPYSQDVPHHDAIPWTAIQDDNAHQGFYAGIEFSGRVKLAISRNSGHTLNANLGLDPGLEGSEAFETRILPGQSFTAPTVFLGCYHGDVDDGANRLRHWVASDLRPKVHDPNYPLVTLNTWGIGMGINEASALAMVHLAKNLHMEMFHVDAGWFRGPGDWRPNLSKFPNGLEPLIKEVHSVGLKFGLWVGWTQGGIDSDQKDGGTVINVFDPARRDWFAHPPAPGWKPSDFVGADICLASDEAEKWCTQLLLDIVGRYNIDMLEHDQRMVVDSCDQIVHGHTASSSDVAFHAANGYYKVYDSVRARYPNLLFEDCVNGGRMVDYGVVKRVDYISISDTYTPLENRQAFYDASYALPPSMCECYVAGEPWMSAPVKSDDEFLTMIRSGMMGWFTLMVDPSVWTDHFRDLFRHEVDLYKSTLRPLIRSGNLYHATTRPKAGNWDAIQYCSQDGATGAIVAFRSNSSQSEYQVPVKGLDQKRKYLVSFDFPSQTSIVKSGEEIMSHGILVKIGNPSGSQIVSITADSKG